MIIATTPSVGGFRVAETKGHVFGLVVRSRGLAGNLAAGLRSLVGGEIHEYTQPARGHPPAGDRPDGPERDADGRQRGPVDALRQLGDRPDDVRDRGLRDGGRPRARRRRAGRGRVAGDDRGRPGDPRLRRRGHDPASGWAPDRRPTAIAPRARHDPHRRARPDRRASTSARATGPSRPTLHNELARARRRRAGRDRCRRASGRPPRSSSTRRRAAGCAVYLAAAAHR